MNNLKNWRWWVLYSLFAAGSFTAALIFGDDERPVLEWVEIRLHLAIIAVACFYTMAHLTKKWEREGKIKI